MYLVGGKKIVYHNIIWISKVSIKRMEIFINDRNMGSCVLLAFMALLKKLKLVDALYYQGFTFNYCLFFYLSTLIKNKKYTLGFIQCSIWNKLINICLYLTVLSIHHKKDLRQDWTLKTDADAWKVASSRKHLEREIWWTKKNILNDTSKC